MRVLVIPPPGSTSWVPPASAAGGLAGSCSALLIHYCTPNDPWYTIVLFGPATAAATFAGCLSTRGRGAAASSAAFAASHFAALTTLNTVLDSTGVTAALTFRWSTLGGMVLVTSAVSLAFGLLALVLYALRARCLVSFRAQDGLLCFRCGYARGSSAVTRCPECGTPVGQGQRFARLLRSLAWSHKWGSRALAPAILLVAAGLIFWGSLPRTRRIADFYRHFPEPLGGYVDAPAGPTPCSGAWLGFAPGPGLGIWISFSPDDTPGAPAMMLRLAWRSESSGEASVAPVQPRLTCRLDRGQADAVIARGIPASLLAFFRDHFAGAAGQKAISIPAAPYFP